MKTLPKAGDHVICEIGDMLILSQVTEVYENGDICTKYHGIRTKNEYRLKTKNVYLATVHIVPHYRIEKERWRNFLQKQFTNKRKAQQWVKETKARFADNRTAFCDWSSVKELR